VDALDVCGRVDKEVEWDTRNRNKIVDGIPLINRWTDRIDKPRVRTVLEVLYRL